AEMNGCCDGRRARLHDEACASAKTWGVVAGRRMPCRESRSQMRLGTGPRGNRALCPDYLIQSHGAKACDSRSPESSHPTSLDAGQSKFDQIADALGGKDEISQRDAAARLEDSSDFSDHLLPLASSLHFVEHEV